MKDIDKKKQAHDYEKAYGDYIIKLGEDALAKAEKRTGTTFSKIGSERMEYENRLLRETLGKRNYMIVLRADSVARFGVDVLL